MATAPHRSDELSPNTENSTYNSQFSEHTDSQQHAQQEQGFVPDQEKIPAPVEHDSKLPPKYDGTYPELGYAEANGGHVYPQAVDTDNFPQARFDHQLPEARNLEGAEVVTGQQAQAAEKPKRICGLRKLWFFVLLAIILIIIILAAVLGGVLGSRASNDNSSTRILSTTALAAVNYTEDNGVLNRRVYFQAENNDLYQSAWDSNSQQWQVSPLNPNHGSSPKIKTNTPIAAFVHSYGKKVAEYHVFFIDKDNTIQEKGSYDPTDLWGQQTSLTMSGNFTAHNSSKLAAYAQACDSYCVQTSIIAWQDISSKLKWAGYIDNSGWYSFDLQADSNHSAVAGTGLSMSPVYTNNTSTVSLYANTGSLTRFNWNQLTDWKTNSWSFNSSYGSTIAQNASIASFHMGYNGTNNSMSDMEALVSDASASGGVWAWDSNFSRQDLTNNTAADSVFASVSSGTAIAASAGGYVYAFEGSTLVEYSWQSSTRTFKREGVVNTQIS